MSSNLVPCVSNTCGVSNHIMGSLEHSRCQVMAGRRAGGGSLSSQPPANDFNWSIPDGGIPAIPVPKNYDQDEVTDQLEEQYEVVIMGNYASSPAEMDALSNWVAEYGDPEEVIRFTEEYSDEVDIRMMEDALMERATAGDKAEFAYVIDGADADALCESVLSEDKGVSRDIAASNFLSIETVSPENRKRIYEDLKHSPNAVVQFQLLTKSEHVDADLAQDMVYNDPSPRSYWVERFAAFHPNPDVHKMSETICRNIKDWGSYSTIREFVDNHDVSAADAQTMMDAVDKSWERIQTEKRPVVADVGRPYYQGVSSALEEIIRRG